MLPMTPDTESALRLACFLGALGAMLAWEAVAPFRDARMPVLRRRLVNLVLVAIDTACVRVLVPVAATGTAAWAAGQGVGLFNAVALPAPVAIPAAVLVLECAIYWQHRLMHVVPALWRLHRVHHSDPDFDTTTAVRFHPIEIVLSMLLKMALVLLLGAPVAAVVIFEVLLSASSLFNHGNVRLAPALEARVRRVLVTPDVHRVHHSTVRAECDSNYGFLLTWWDRLFGTWRAEAGAGQAGIDIGVTGWGGAAAVSLPALLAQPFRPSP